ncbi:MAG: hypothetical protein DMF24_00475 [Verrucomicrobia bacterium]|nr:MAG: hypothetical protein DME90_07260 [Verrucomicrobiota bacterium]PYL63450.1 MAG: hypothetical protein DMF24_00475 [Verrucomicrobiota bacterium]
MLMNAGATTLHARHGVDQTLMAMQEMEHYCSAHPTVRRRYIIHDSPFAAGLSLRCWPKYRGRHCWIWRYCASGLARV